MWYSVFDPQRCFPNRLLMTQAAKLRALPAEDRCHIMPCCLDALSAKLVAQDGYDLTFMSGFAA